MQRELKKESLGEVEKKVTKKDFAREATRQKALEWIDESSGTVDGQLLYVRLAVC